MGPKCSEYLHSTKKDTDLWVKRMSMFMIICYLCVVTDLRRSGVARFWVNSKMAEKWKASFCSLSHMLSDQQRCKTRLSTDSTRCWGHHISPTAQVTNFSLWQLHVVIVSLWQYHKTLMICGVNLATSRIELWQPVTGRYKCCLY